MLKKFGILIFSFFIFLIVAAAGFFYWQGQKDVRELNKSLPKGVRVAKSLIGQEYKVVNKIDGYEFKVPQEWRGVEEIEYVPEREENNYRGTSINLEGIESPGRTIGIDRFISGGDFNEDLESWAISEFRTFGLVGDFIKIRVKESDAVKIQENIHLGGEYVYFFRENNAIYSITGPSDSYIQYIISNGRW